ncbi:unnamed protein product [Pieris brassicae]|nr:unnamed protein product [Pieris brassicae]
MQRFMIGGTSRVFGILERVSRSPVLGGLVRARVRSSPALCSPPFPRAAAARTRIDTACQPLHRGTLRPPRRPGPCSPRTPFHASSTGFARRPIPFPGGGWCIRSDTSGAEASRRVLRSADAMPVTSAVAAKPTQPRMKPSTEPT